MVSFKSIGRKALMASAVVAAFALAGCVAYPEGYGAYAWDYGPGYYGYAPGYWPGYYNGLFVAGGGPVVVGRGRVVHRRGVRVGHRAPRVVSPGGRGFAAAHGGVGKFGMRVGGGRPGGAHVAAGRGGIGHFGGGR